MSDEEDIRRLRQELNEMAARERMIAADMAVMRTQARLMMSERESKLTMYMRLLVVGTFAIVGPILLLVYAFNLSVDPTLLDILKIWLGAAIGISTNLLQREKTVIPPEIPVEQEPPPATPAD